MDFYHTGGRIEKLENQRDWLYRPDSGGYQWRGESPMPSEYQPKPIMHRYSAEEDEDRYAHPRTPVGSETYYPNDDHYDNDTLRKYVGCTHAERMYNATVDQIHTFMVKLESLEDRIGYPPPPAHGL